MEQPMGYGSRVTVTGGKRDIVGGAIHKVSAGKKTDLQFHVDTEKVFYILSGKLKVNIMKNATLQSIEVPADNAFAVGKGLVYQLEGIEDTVVVEFISDASSYLVVDGKMPNDDVVVIARGTPLPAPAVEEKKEEPKAEEPKKTTKKAAKKKRSKKTTKKSSRKSN